MSERPRPDLPSDEFGYIPFPITAECRNYIVEPREDIQERVSAVEAAANRDGYFYPPQQTTYTVDPYTGAESPIPRSTRPAHLHTLPATHTIRYLTGPSLPSNFRSCEGALLINLLALLYCTRSQFWDWYFDGRVRVKKDRVAWFRDNDGTASRVLSRVYESWATWTTDTQILYSNALWIHARAQSYEWEWERFIMRYMAIDAAWAIARSILHLDQSPHGKRIEILCDRFGLANNPDQAKEFVRLRNDLMHEALWDRTRPCSAGSVPAAMAEVYLGNLSARLLLSVGGVRGEFVKSDWKSIDMFPFWFK